MRPTRLSELIGQEHLVGEGGIIGKAIASGNIPSMILWGPPGVGKTTIANIIANEVKMAFHTLSAVSAGVKDVREVIDKAVIASRQYAKRQRTWFRHQFDVTWTGIPGKNPEQMLTKLGLLDDF